MILLDTNVVSELMRPTPDVAVQRWLVSVRPDRFVVCSITVMEITFGIERLPKGRRRDQLQARFEALAAPGADIEVLSVDENVARLAGLFLARRLGVGRPASEADMVIAGCAASHSAILATRDIQDFDLLNLSLVNPWSA